MRIDPRVGQNQGISLVAGINSLLFVGLNISDAWLTKQVLALVAGINSLLFVGLNISDAWLTKQVLASCISPAESQCYSVGSLGNAVALLASIDNYHRGQYLAQAL